MSDHQSAGVFDRPDPSSFSRSRTVAQLIIVGWSGSEFQTGNSSIKLQKWSCEVWSCIFSNVRAVSMFPGSNMLWNAYKLPFGFVLAKPDILFQPQLVVKVDINSNLSLNICPMNMFYSSNNTIFCWFCSTSAMFLPRALKNIWTEIFSWDHRPIHVTQITLAGFL